jgi:hypothetical protein
MAAANQSPVLEDWIDGDNPVRVIDALQKIYIDIDTY